MGWMMVVCVGVLGGVGDGTSALSCHAVATLSNFFKRGVLLPTACLSRSHRCKVVGQGGVGVGVVFT